MHRTLITKNIRQICIETRIEESLQILHLLHSHTRKKCYKTSTLRQRQGRAPARWQPITWSSHIRVKGGGGTTMQTWLYTRPRDFVALGLKSAQNNSKAISSHQSCAYAWLHFWKGFVLMHETVWWVCFDSLMVLRHRDISTIQKTTWHILASIVEVTSSSLECNARGLTETSLENTNVIWCAKLTK